MDSMGPLSLNRFCKAWKTHRDALSEPGTLAATCTLGVVLWAWYRTTGFMFRETKAGFKRFSAVTSSCYDLIRP